MSELTPVIETSKQRQECRLAGVIFFAILALGILYATFVILDPFLAPIMLGAVLVTVTFPIYRRVRERLHGANRAASVMLILITFTVLLPAFLIIVLLVQEANV